MYKKLYFFNCYHFLMIILFGNSYYKNYIFYKLISASIKSIYKYININNI
jgi:hypothetical protein